MAVGVLLLTHNAIGPALIEAARHVLGPVPLELDCVEIGADCDPESMLRISAARARDMDSGDGVLVLADAFGATPCNIALRLDAMGVRLKCVSGLNLPMLLRVLNYAEQPLETLAETAASGGRSGIFVDKT